MLITISGNFILYKDGMIHFKTKPVQLNIEGRMIITSFNVLLLGKNEAVLRMPFLQKFNLKINWIIGKVKIKDI